MHQEVDLDLIIPAADQAIIFKAAMLAHEGQHAEAEVVRYAAGYHNLKEDTDT